MKRPETALLAGVALATIVGCSDATRATETLGRRASVAVTDNDGTPERQALTALTKAIARSLDDGSLRNNLKNRLRSAPYREHKLELRTLLQSQLLNEVAQRSGMTAEQLSGLMLSVRPLEIYMAVPDHRATWTGGSNLLLVSQLEDSSQMIAFNLKGDRVSVSRDVPPSTPTISIVPVETRFDQPLNMSEWRNDNDLNGAAIGTLVRRRELTPRMMEECGESCGGGGGSYGYETPGYYMTFSRIVDDGEPWTKGDPEIEIHFHGPTEEGNTQYGADLSCSGEHALPEKTFDQNDAFWNGSVLLFSQTQEDEFASRFTEGHHVIAWEDDDTPCVIKQDHQTVIGVLAEAAAAAGGAALKKVGVGGATIPLMLGTFLATALQDANWLLSNDDILGVYVPAPIGTWSDANYTLMKGSTVNGRARFVQK
jgi:hypothetical protein